VNPAALLEGLLMREQRKANLNELDEVRGMCEELGNAAQKNPPVYGERYGITVSYGTGEALPSTL